MKDFTTPATPSTTPRKPQHFFWIESAFLHPSFQDFLSKSAWAAYVLLCRRARPLECSDGIVRSVAFSGVNDLITTFGISHLAATKALEELRQRGFVRACPNLPPTPGLHLLRGAATEVLLLPFLALELKQSIPFTSAPRALSYVLPEYLGERNRPIFVPSKLINEGKFKRLLRAWTAMRLAFRIYDLVDHSTFGAVPHTLLHARAVEVDGESTRIVTDEDGVNPALVGKEVAWVQNFDEAGFDDASRYHLHPDFYAHLGLTEIDAIKTLIFLKKEGVIRWKCAVVADDAEDPNVSTGYENTPGQYRWLQTHAGMIPVVRDYFGQGVLDRPLFVATPVLQAATRRVYAYRAERAAEHREFRAWAEEWSEGEDDV